MSFIDTAGSNFNALTSSQVSTLNAANSGSSSGLYPVAPVNSAATEAANPYSGFAIPNADPYGVGGETQSDPSDTSSPGIQTGETASQNIKTKLSGLGDLLSFITSIGGWERVALVVGGIAMVLIGLIILGAQQAAPYAARVARTLE